MFGVFKDFSPIYTLLLSRMYMRYAITYYTFLCRLDHYPKARVNKVKAHLAEHGRTLKDLHRLHYDLFQRGFCALPKEKCRINLHTFSHMEEVYNTSGEVWRNSAECFESMYAVVRRCYKSGTRNTSKQALENFFMRDMWVFYRYFHGISTVFNPLRTKHRCRHKESLVVTPISESNSSICDSYIVTNRGVRVVQSMDEDAFYCHPVVVEEFNTDFVGINLPWKLVGVYK